MEEQNTGQVTDPPGDQPSPEGIAHAFKSAFFNPSTRALLFYLLVALGVTFQTATGLADGVLGSPLTDTWNALWSIDFVKRSLLQGQLPFHTMELFWPEGGSLYPINLINALLVLPLHLFIPLPAVYNILVLAMVVVGAMGMRALVFWVTRSEGGALYAGLCFAICPMMFNTIHNGTDEFLGLCWVPWCVLCLLKLSAATSRRQLFAAVVVMTITALSCWYITLIIALFGVIIFVHHGLALGGQRRRAFLRRFVAVSAMSAILCLPFYYVFHKSISSPGAVTEYKTISAPILKVFPSRARDFFVPAPLWSRSMMEIPDPRKKLPSSDLFYSHTVYLGYLALGMGLVGFFVRGRRVSRGLWLFCFVFFLLFSMGPRPGSGGGPPDPSGLEHVLPYNLLNHVLPLSSMVSHLFRFTGMAYVAIFMLAGCGAAWILTSLSERKRGVVLGLLLGATLFEYLVLAPVPFPVSVASATVPKPLQELAQQPGRAILVMPSFHPIQRGLKPGVYHQILHRKALTWGFDVSHRVTDKLRFNEIQDWINWYSHVILSHARAPKGMLLGGKLPVLRNDRYQVAIVTPGTQEHREFQEAIKELREMSFLHLVVHKDLLPEEADWPWFLDSLLGKPILSSEETAIYRIGGAGR